MLTKRRSASTIFFLLLLLLIGSCKKIPTTTTIDQPGEQAIAASCDPTSAGPDTVITVSVLIKGNNEEIRVFGLDATFDTKMFQFQGASSGSLTGDWAAVDGNEASPGELKVGGFVGGGTAIPKNSNGSLANLKFKVTGQSYGNGQQSEICITQYTDDISAFTPARSCTTFTLKK
jgi:hypothetical protein